MGTTIGFSNYETNALNSSKFETLEHLYATYDFNRDTILKNTGFWGTSLGEQITKSRKFPASEVIIGSVPKNIGKSSDANGLGCHIFYEKAVEHAILEIIERHFLAQIWYGKVQVLEIKQKVDFQFLNFRLRSFTCKNTPVPFAIVIIDNLKEGIWALGSSVRLSMALAAEHARNEAMMLIESSLAQKGISYSEEIEKRLLSLKDIEISTERERFFSSKIKGTIEPIFSHLISDFDKMIKISLGNFCKIWCVDLCKSEALNVVRILCSSAENPRWHRDINKQIPYDPFC